MNIQHSMAQTPTHEYTTCTRHTAQHVQNKATKTLADHAYTHVLSMLTTT